MADQQDTKGSNPKHIKSQSSKYLVVIILGIVCASLVAIYVGGGLYFSAYFMPRTTLNGEPVSGKAKEDIKNRVATAGKNYGLSITGDNLNLQLKSDDISLSYDGKRYAQSAIDQTNPWSWPVSIASPHALNITAGISYDPQKLEQAIKAAVDANNAKAQAPVNASLGWDDQQKKWIIHPEVIGTTIQEEAVQKAAQDAIASQATTLQLDTNYLVQPQLFASDAKLQAAQKQANAYSSAPVSLTINGSEVAKLDINLLKSWVHLGDDLSVSFDTAAATKYAQTTLSKAIDTTGTERSYTRPDGKKFTVKGGRYGWNIDGSKLADTLSTNLAAGNAAPLEIPMHQKAVTWKQGSQDWGPRYIDVDINEQHARMYDDTSQLIWESDIVSGDPTNNDQTPEGVYTINSNKGRDQTLKGLDKNHDGEPDYISHVAYWMPFVDNLVAFHDAPWRSRFGKDIYEGRGSHGCVNLPPDMAAKLYDLTKDGDVVVVHE